MRERRLVPSVLQDESSSLSELELPLAPRPGGSLRREEDDELDQIAGGKEAEIE